MGNPVKTKWAIDPAHSEISFKVKHLMITNVKGIFRDFSASVITNGEDFMTRNIEFTLNPASVDTGAPDRDEHLRAADFFDVEKYGRISFSGNKAEKTEGKNTYFLSGDLTIKDIPVPVRLKVEFAGVMKDQWGNEKAGYTLHGKVNRRDWGLNWNAALEAGGLLLSDIVYLECDVQLVKQA